MTVRSRLADRLARSSTPASLLVVSDGPVGSMLATDIDAAQVQLVTDSPTLAAQTPDSVRTTVGDVTATDTLAAGADATIAVVALGSDRQALLVTQLLRTQFETDALVVLLNDPQRAEAFDGVATTVVCGSTCLSVELRTALERTLPESTLSDS